MTVPIKLVNDIEPRAQYTANGSQTEFDVSFPIRSVEELVVQFGDGQTPDIGYACDQPNDDAGFKVLFTNPPPAGTRITFLRSGEIAFQANLGQERAFNAAAFNATVGDIYLRLLELRATLRRTFRLPDSDPLADLITPTVAERANRFAYFDATGRLTALASAFDAVLDFAAYPGTTPLATDTVLLNRPGEPAATLVRRTTLAELATLLVATAGKPFRTAQDVGMAGNGTADDSFRLHADMEAQAQLGGCAYFLRSPVPGGSFYFKGTPRVPSNVSLFWFSPVLFAKDAGLQIAGDYAVEPNRGGFKLLEAATQGAATLKIDTSPHGGGVLSTYFAPDDILHVVGLRDGCGTPLQEQIVRVLSVNDGTGVLTIAETNDYAWAVSYAAGDYQANYTEANQTVIRKLVSCIAQADLSIGQNLVTVRSGDIGKLTEGDLVLVADELRSDQLSGTAGSASVRINHETRPIGPSVPGDAAASYRLAGRVEHDFTTAKKLRLIKLNPSTGAVVSGARALFAEAPDLTPLRHVFVTRLARGAKMISCDVPNTDQYGRRGNAFRQEFCFDCGGEDVSASGAKYYAAGEGYGWVWGPGATDGWLRGARFDGLRHSVLAMGGTNCHDHETRISNPRSTAWDCHGQGEAGCCYHDIVIDGSTAAESSPGRAPNPISFGNTTWLGGTRKCGGFGGRVVGFTADTGATLAAVRLVPGYRDCFIDGTEFVNVGQVLSAEDVTGFGTVTGSGFRLVAKADGVALAKMFDVHGRRNGASVDTIRDLRIAVTARNINGGGIFRYVTELELENNKWDEVTPDASFTYAVEAENITGFKLSRNDFASFSRGVKLTNVTELRANFNVLADQANATVLNDAGGNTGFWHENVAEGFNPLFQSSNSLIAFWPRLPAAVDLADDAVLKVLPAANRGQAFFYSLSGTSFVAQFAYYTVTPAIDVGGASSPIVDFTTGALTGTTGVDGKITISAHTDGTLQIENRTGAVLKVDGTLS